MRKPALYYVESIDHCAHTTGWRDDLDGVRLAMRVATVGFRVGETKDVLILAQTIDQDTGEFNHCWSIPKATIKRKRRLKP